MSHEAHVVHLPTGWLRWAIRCPDCTLYEVVWNRDAADEAVVAHAVETTEPETECRCYDPALMEHDPAGPCATCRGAA